MIMVCVGGNHTLKRPTASGKLGSTGLLNKQQETGNNYLKGNVLPYASPGKLWWVPGSKIGRYPKDGSREP